MTLTTLNREVSVRNAAPMCYLGTSQIISLIVILFLICFASTYSQAQSAATPTLDDIETWLSNAVADQKNYSATANWSFRNPSADRTSHEIRNYDGGQANWGDNEAEATAHKGVTSITVSLSFVNCTATLHRVWNSRSRTEWVWSFNGKSTYSEWYFEPQDNTYVFNLKDLLPSSIKASDATPASISSIKDCDDSCVMHWVHMTTVADKIQLNGNSVEHDLWYTAPSLDVAQRMAKAWSDAAVACGAKEINKNLY